MKALRLFVPVLMLCLVALTGCVTSGDSLDASKVDETPVVDLYNEAAKALDEEEYQEATRLFEEVERQHPYSEWAAKAEIMAAFSSYKDTRYDEAILALDRYIELHPGNEEIDYALYLKALCFYEQIVDVARDQAMTTEALKSLDMLVRRFPTSEYTRDATLKRDLVLDHLAGKEMEIGRYYLNRKEINAAMNRFQTVVKDYQTTTHVAEALHRLVEAYLTLGIKGEATRIAAVLGYNYPGSKWYQDTYRILDDEQRQQLLDDRDWMDRTVESIFKPG